MAGRLEVIAGCMFAGKTEELLRRVERARIGKKHVLVMKPENETRYSETEVVTHYGRSVACHRVPLDISLETLEKRFGPEFDQIEVVAFDDAQFFDESQFPLLCEELVKKGKRVIVAGLDLDFKGDPFGPMAKLLALADEVLKLQAVCVKCGKPATRTQRLIDGKPVSRNSPVIIVGGLDLYEARCRDCWEVPD
jgi:thymidine kinase